MKSTFSQIAYDDLHAIAPNAIARISAATAVAVANRLDGEVLTDGTALKDIDPAERPGTVSFWPSLLKQDAVTDVRDLLSEDNTDGQAGMRAFDAAITHSTDLSISVCEERRHGVVRATFNALSKAA